ncbi:hypothetical protein ACFX19_014661 [Malus domestica]
MQEGSFYWWRFKCALELNASLYKNLHLTELQKSKRRLLRNRKGVCFLKSWAAQRPRGPISEIEEAFIFSKARLLKDHEGRSQKSMRCLRSQKLGCLEITRADLINRSGTCFFSLVSTCHMHTQLCGNYGHSVEDFW